MDKWKMGVAWRSNDEVIDKTSLINAKLRRSYNKQQLFHSFNPVNFALLNMPVVNSLIPD